LFGLLSVWKIVRSVLIVGLVCWLLVFELFILGEDYVSMVACQDEIDVALLSALREAGGTGRQSGELAVQLDVDHRDVSRRVYRMNRRMGQEIGETIILKHGHKWKLIPRLRRDFAAAR
jgi:hypothetical protein